MAQRAPQQVDGDERAEVADVPARVDRQAARVHAHDAVVRRGELLFLAGERVVEAHAAGMIRRLAIGELDAERGYARLGVAPGRPDGSRARRPPSRTRSGARRGARVRTQPAGQASATGRTRASGRSRRRRSSAPLAASRPSSAAAGTAEHAARHDDLHIQRVGVRLEAACRWPRSDEDRLGLDAGRRPGSRSPPRQGVRRRASRQPPPRRPSCVSSRNVSPSRGSPDTVTVKAPGADIRRLSGKRPPPVRGHCTQASRSSWRTGSNGTDGLGRQAVEQLRAWRQSAWICATRASTLCEGALAAHPLHEREPHGCCRRGRDRSRRCASRRRHAPPARTSAARRCW